MSDEFSALNLKDDLEEALKVPEAAGWALEMAGDLEVFVTMSPTSAPAEHFQARLLWTKYPDEPPSLKFRDPTTGRLDLPQAWPMVRGFRPQSLDACVNWCLEGFNLHPEWRSDSRFRWDPNGSPFLRVLRQLQEELDDYFQGRFK
jgi:hypothetical protein